MTIKECNMLAQQYADKHGQFALSELLADWKSGKLEEEQVIHQYIHLSIAKTLLEVRMTLVRP